MKIKGHNVTLKELFTLDKSNHNTLYGGFMGFAHAGVSCLIMGLIWYFLMRLSVPGVINQLPDSVSMVMIQCVIMCITWALNNLWWLTKETKFFTVSLFKPRSTPLVTLDTRMDFFNPLFWTSVILYSWFKSKGLI